MKQFDIAVIGCGGVSRMHFDGYIEHPERVRLVAACDLDTERTQHVQQTYGIKQTFNSIEALIEGADWEVAVVCTPTHVRKAVIETLAAAGKHIFVEKPLADSYSEAREMVTICDRAGVQLAVDQNFRYHYPFEHARQLVAEGLIGELVHIAHQELNFRQDRGWRLDMPRHALSVMGVHWFDGFRWIAQSAPVSLLCHTTSSPAIHCAGETDAFTQLLFESGLMVSYVQSFSTALRRAETVVNGTEGTLVLQYGSIALHDAEHRESPKQVWENPYAGPKKPESAFRCLDELLTALEEEREPTNSGRDNLKTIALLDAAYRSAEGGALVTFAEGVAA